MIRFFLFTAPHRSLDLPQAKLRNIRVGIAEAGDGVLGIELGNGGNHVVADGFLRLHSQAGEYGIDHASGQKNTHLDL
ncbi:MAG: hypothetical protein IJZ80_08550 [Clostridia bacterium]|nr:hypothetical protein [Clostridia bacterium]